MREANDRGYECLLVEDATESYFPEFKQSTRHGPHTSRHRRLDGNQRRSSSRPELNPGRWRPSIRGMGFGYAVRRLVFKMTTNPSVFHKRFGMNPAARLGVSSNPSENLAMQPAELEVELKLLALRD